MRLVLRLARTRSSRWAPASIRPRACHHWLTVRTALELVAPGGTYLIDDLSPQPGWPESHDSSVKRLLARLDEREDFRCVRLAWASGLLMSVRTA
jgi:hypothetical protein